MKLYISLGINNLLETADYFPCRTYDEALGKAEEWFDEYRIDEFDTETLERRTLVEETAKIRHLRADARPVTDE